MKYLKIFESKIQKTFSGWLKSPQKPEETVDSDVNKTDYIFSISGTKEVTLVDNGDFNTTDLLTYITDQEGSDSIWTDMQDAAYEITGDENITKKSLKKNTELLDQAFERSLKDRYGSTHYWGRFLKEYFESNSPLDEDDYEKLYKVFSLSNITFKNEEASFRVFSTDLISNSDAYKYIDNTGGRIYIKITTSRKLRDDEEIEWVTDYVESISGEMQHKVANDRRYSREVIQNSDGGRISFNIDIILDEVKLEYPKY